MARGLRRDEAFDELFPELIPDAAVRERVLVGIRATLCENPFVGIPLSDHPDTVWYVFLAEAEAWGFDQLILLYTFTDTDVTLHGLSTADPSPP